MPRAAMTQNAAWTRTIHCKRSKNRLDVCQLPNTSCIVAIVVLKILPKGYDHTKKVHYYTTVSPHKSQRQGLHTAHRTALF